MREEDDGALLGNLERIVSVAGLIAGECRSCTAVDTAYAKGPDGVGEARIRDKITVEQMLREMAKPG
ncbi:MAG: hypothetical protein KF909_13880 [Rhodocyclaceae bacterium]|nr:hypothetical protein [Rhodocyclaceae bacterium]MCP5238286.1 hypothetical protein [Zoogloeaceae bacterium]MCP5255343.1 hypothetical protein [Zoogloeaceae bacterium]MCP5294497.1 hypothetical protein [Zoogloeaceae bacterium]